MTEFTDKLAEAAVEVVEETRRIATNRNLAVEHRLQAARLILDYSGWHTPPAKDDADA